MLIPLDLAERGVNDLEADLDLPRVRQSGGQNRTVLGPQGRSSRPRRKARSMIRSRSVGVGLARRAWTSTPIIRPRPRTSRMQRMARGQRVQARRAARRPRRSALAR